MKAVYIDAFAKKGNVKIGDLPEPPMEEGDVCIAVHYAGVNPVDGKIAEGLLQHRMPHVFPLILGWEASGVISRVSKGVTSLKVGDEVYTYCRRPVRQWGAWAQYLTFAADHVALVPKNISLAESAGVPLAGLTAWQALFDKLKMQAGEWVLIHGGGGGVGGFAIQFAKARGCRVITTASGAKVEYVKELGADEVIDYQKERFVEAVLSAHPRGIEAVFDTVGAATYKDSFAVLKQQGRIVSLLEQPNDELSRQYGVRAEYLFVSPNGAQLKEITRLFEEGKVRPLKVRSLPLDLAETALEEIREGHTMGKIVLQVM